MNFAAQARKERSTRVGFIYFLQVDEDGPIKIGFSVNPKGRYAGIASGSHVEINLLGFILGTAADEKVIQNRFITLVLRNEWFRPGRELTDFIAGVLQTGRVPEDCRGDEFTPSHCRALTERRARASRWRAAA